MFIIITNCLAKTLVVMIDLVAIVISLVKIESYDCVTLVITVNY